MNYATLSLLLCTAYSAIAVPVEDELSPKPYQRFVQFPDGDGVLHDVDLEESPDTELLTEVSRDPANNLYLLYTQRNPDSAQSLLIDDADSIRRSNFDARDSTVVIVHGWMSSQNSNLNPVIRDAFLSQGKVNVIVVDWRRLAVSGYVTAVLGVPDVGRGLAQFLAFLNSVTGAPFDSMHLVGFNLGAHLVGNAGRELDGRVARVTGLDPAGHLWYANPNRLSSKDGVYVEAIHTDGEVSYESFGIGVPVADADFFPNGGSSQPGCITSICNTNRAWEFFAATVEYDHLVARKCSNILQLNLNRCRGEELNMGNSDLKKSGSGTYRVNTKRRYPY